MSFSHLHDKPMNYLRNPKNVEPGHAKLYQITIVADCKAQYAFLCIHVYSVHYLIKDSG